MTDPIIEIRRLWQSDMDAYCNHLLRLDLHSRRFRFVGGMSNEAVKNYAEKCFGTGDLIYGAFINGTLIGVAELRSTVPILANHVQTNRHIHAEVAFSVELEYQHHGIGENYFLELCKQHQIMMSKLLI